MLLITLMCLSLLQVETFGISYGGIHFRHRKDSLKMFSVSLGAQSNRQTGGLLDVSNGKVFRLLEATGHQKEVDIVYVYGKSTKLNLLTPASSRIKDFGKNLRQGMAGAWSVFNKGYLINIRHGKQARKLYRKVRTAAELIAAYKRTKTMVKQFADYSSLVNGPARSIRKISPGDIIVFKSSDKGLYAMGRVVDYSPGYQGVIRMDFKVVSGVF